MAGELVVRPAWPSDRAAVERVCAHTWEWGDYIPEVWDEWLADQDGALLVGEIEGQVVAVGRVAFLAHEQAWFEAMRVDPDYRQRGIAGQFLQHKLALARSRESQVVRLATSASNTPVHRMMDAAGMARVGSYALRTAEPTDQGPPITLLSPEEAGAVQASIEASSVLAHNRGLYSVDWAWQELSSQRAVELLAAGQMAGLRGPDGRLQALAQFQYTANDERLWIGYADGDPPAVTHLARTIRTHAARVGAPRADIMLPELPWLRDAFHQAGYKPGDWDGELWIFEKRLAPEAVADALEKPEGLQTARAERGDDRGR